jgi:hypothetical protein
MVITEGEYDAMAVYQATGNRLEGLAEKKGKYWEIKRNDEKYREMLGYKGKFREIKGNSVRLGIGFKKEI